MVYPTNQRITHCRIFYWVKYKIAAANKWTGKKQKQVHTHDDDDDGKSSLARYYKWRVCDLSKSERHLTIMNQTKQQQKETNQQQHTCTKSNTSIVRLESHHPSFLIHVIIIMSITCTIKKLCVTACGNAKRVSMPLCSFVLFFVTVATAATFCCCRWMKLSIFFIWYIFYYVVIVLRNWQPFLSLKWYTSRIWGRERGTAWSQHSQRVFLWYEHINIIVMKTQIRNLVFYVQCLMPAHTHT